MIIAVASAGRPDKVITIGSHWPKKWVDRTFLVVPNSQYRLYKDATHWPNIVTHANINRLSPTRDWINDYFGFSDPHIVHADDDSRFFDRRDKLRPITVERLEEELDWFDQQLRAGFIYVGMGFRFMCQSRPEVLEYPPGISNFYGVNRDALCSLQFRFSQTELLQGQNLAITVARSGYRSRMRYAAVYHQPVVNASGGCSQYRTGEMYDRAVEAFQEIHGERYISFREREVKWPGMEGMRKLIRVNWRLIKEEHPPTKLWLDE